jgi:predicted ATP-binding protein involved in virulence
MKLLSIVIRNYRSIGHIKFSITKLPDGTFTYGLIGINEAGKSSILQSLALLDARILPTALDFQDKNLPIEVEYEYLQDSADISACKDIVAKSYPDIKISDKDLTNVNIKITYNLPDLQTVRSISFKDISDEKLKMDIEALLLDEIYDSSHYTIYWKYAEKYLITDQISLSQFSADPEGVSIPLFRCFELCGYTTKEKIQKVIQDIAVESTEQEALRNELGEKVTSLIRKVWPKHPITITFNISGDSINFHVKDSTKKSKLTSQRSDGFKQFISFLLNVSAQKESDSLSNSLILLDEPETHLHPQAQEYFLKELIKLTSSDIDNNVCFFVTHSNYMVDKGHPSRNFKVTKRIDDEKTEVYQFDENDSTYASVNFDVFGILDDSYHNELYDTLRQRYLDEINRGLSDEERKETIGIRAFDERFFSEKLGLKKVYPEKGKKNQVTLPTFIRNCIHYPINKTTSFLAGLEQSIILMRKYNSELIRAEAIEEMP